MYSTIVKLGLRYTSINEQLLLMSDKWDSTFAPLENITQTHASKAIDGIQWVITSVITLVVYMSQCFHKWDNMRVTRNLGYINTSSSLVVEVPKLEVPKPKVTLGSLKLQAKVLGVKGWNSYKKIESLQLAISNYV